MRTVYCHHKALEEEEKNTIQGQMDLSGIEKILIHYNMGQISVVLFFDDYCKYLLWYYFNYQSK